MKRKEREPTCPRHRYGSDCTDLLMLRKPESPVLGVSRLLAQIGGQVQWPARSVLPVGAMGDVVGDSTEEEECVTRRGTKSKPFAAPSKPSGAYSATPATGSEASCPRHQGQGQNITWIPRPLITSLPGGLARLQQNLLATTNNKTSSLNLCVFPAFPQLS